MNWLAHIQLSGDSAATKIGNLIPDLVRASTLDDLPDKFMPGIRLHRLIDSYTDSHPIFRKSMSRIDGDLRRYASILIDLFYDHYLAREWSNYSQEPLEKVVDDFHQSIDFFRLELPTPVYAKLVLIRDGRYLSSYSTMEGIAAALSRVSSRLRRPFDLTKGVEQLETHYKLLEVDFKEFYPLLVAHINPQTPNR